MAKATVSQLTTSLARLIAAVRVQAVPIPGQDTDVTAHQARILELLSPSEPSRLTDLARAFGVTPGAMSVAVKHLHELGLVLKERDEEDRRALTG